MNKIDLGSKTPTFVLAWKWEVKKSSKMRRRVILGGASSLLSSNQFPPVPQPVPRVTEIISDIHVRKRRSSHVSSFSKNRHSQPQKKKANWRKRFYLGLFLTLLIIFLALLSPYWQYLCEFQTSFYYKPTQHDRWNVMHETIQEIWYCLNCIFTRKAWNLRLCWQIKSWVVKPGDKTLIKWTPLAMLLKVGASLHQTHSVWKRWSVWCWHNPQQEPWRVYGDNRFVCTPCLSPWLSKVSAVISSC